MRRISRRHVLQSTMIGSAGALLGAPRVHAAGGDVETVDVTPALIAAAQKEGTVAVRYSSPVDEMRQMADSFTKRFGIKVQMDRKVGVVGTQQFATEEHAGQHVMDVNYSADPAGIDDLIEQGLLLKYTFPDIANRLDAGSYLPDKGYCPKWTEIVISYNPDAIPHDKARDQFKTWNGLLDPSLKGRIGLNEPAGGGVPFATYLMFYRHPQYGRDFLKKLAAQNPRLYPGSAQGREDLAAGGISVFVPNWESIAMLTFLEGDKTAWTYPEIAPAFANTYLVISKKGAAPERSAAVQRLVFSRPKARRVIELAQAKPTLKNVPDDRTAVAKLKLTDWWKTLSRIDPMDSRHGRLGQELR